MAFCNYQDWYDNNINVVLLYKQQIAVDVVESTNSCIPGDFLRAVKQK